MSVKARVESTLAATRLSESPILEANNPNPPVKTAVGISFSALSQAMLGAMNSVKSGLPAAGSIEHLKDALYTSPRLTQWDFHEVSLGLGQWRIYAGDDATFVTVEKGSISLHRGIREVVISNDPLVALTLYNAIETAQGIIQPYEPVQMTEAEQEEFFSSEDMNGADIDSALADAPVEEVPVEDPEIDDAGLIGEVHEKTFSERANQQNSKIDGVICGYCGNMNQQAYRGPCPQCPKGASVFSEKQIEKATVVAQQKVASDSVSRLKSLQGRILNIVEAALADKTQREAVKTLINKEFRRDMNKLSDVDTEE
jgi:hypothetical protein